MSNNLSKSRTPKISERVQRKQRSNLPETVPAARDSLHRIVRFLSFGISPTSKNVELSMLSDDGNLTCCIPKSFLSSVLKVK